MTTTYTAKSAAVRAARKVLGPEAVPGQDFHLTQPEAGKWAWAEGTTAKAPKGWDKADTAPGDAAPDLKTTKAQRKAERKLDANRKASAPRPVSESKRPAAGKRAAALEAAKAGALPTPPDFSAATHARFRGRLDELKAMVEKGDIKGLKAAQINPISTSPKALDRYRNLAVTALEAQKAGARAKAKGGAGGEVAETI